MRDMTGRERDHLVSEVSKIGGLMPLLMKRRNQGAWTAAEKAELRLQVGRLKSISPYLLLSVVPGSFLALPFLAWWLDRRRQLRGATDAADARARQGDSTA
jgi:hypothetical protein